MMLELTPEEVIVLRQVLRGYLSDLRMEIVDTEDYNLREGLKEGEVTIKRLIARLEEPAVDAA